MAFAVEVHARLPLGPALTGFHLRRRRLRLMLRTGQLPPPQRDVVAPLRHRALTRHRKPRYQGPWRLPGPDSHRLAALSLSLGYTMNLLFVHSVRAAGRTLRPEKCGRVARLP